MDDTVPIPTAGTISLNNTQTLSRRTRLLKGDNQFGSHGLGDGPHQQSSVDER